MKRIMLTVAYDGTNYCGWQIQPSGETIEGVLNRELSRLLQEEIRVIGASRTDSGVHAKGAVAVFDTETRIPPEKISYAVNKSLPEDIRVVGSQEVSPEFHPRKTAVKPTNTGSGTMLFPCRRNGCIRTGCIPHWMWTRCGKQRRILSENMILNRSAASIRRRRRPSALFISLKWKRRAQKSGSVCVETASYIIWCASLPEP